jgi:hypothetical protein
MVAERRGASSKGLPRNRMCAHDVDSAIRSSDIQEEEHRHMSPRHYSSAHLAGHESPKGYDLGTVVAKNYPSPTNVKGTIQIAPEEKRQVQGPQLPESP